MNRHKNNPSPRGAKEIAHPARGPSVHGNRERLPAQMIPARPPPVHLIAARHGCIMHQVRPSCAGEGCMYARIGAMTSKRDFSAGRRGTFYKPNVELNLAVYLDPKDLGNRSRLSDLSVSRVAASDSRPGRQPCPLSACFRRGSAARVPKGRQRIAHGVSRGKTGVVGTSPVGAEETSFAPLGLLLCCVQYPRLTPWATF